MKRQSRVRERETEKREQEIRRKEDQNRPNAKSQSREK
jgi:hypothetical protein